MSQVRQWLDQVRLGHLSLGDFVGELNGRGAVDPSTHQAELEDLDALLAGSELDPRLHRAVRLKLIELQGGASPPASADAGSGEPQSPGAPDDSTVFAGGSPDAGNGPSEAPGDATVFGPGSPAADPHPDDATEMLRPEDSGTTPPEDGTRLLTPEERASLTGTRTSVTGIAGHRRVAAQGPLRAGAPDRPGRHGRGVPGHR